MRDLLAAYKPSARQPWDRTRAAHLLRRAGFLPAETDVQQALEAGPGATVERLVDTTRDSDAHNELDEVGKVLAVRNEIDTLRGWWLLRMCRTQRPLAARMSVFWHDHFATSNVKVQSAALMLQQLRTFERHALGSFEAMLQAVSRDPAMIVWLDGVENVKGRPNENYARELFELFGLGVGNYTEEDIKEAARAFTGWHQRRGQYRFIRLSHDYDRKRVFDQQGDFDGDDIVRLVLAQPACSRFLGRKLLREFVCPAPSDVQVEAVAACLRETQFNLADTLRTLFNSRMFFEPDVYRARIKSPVEFVIGTARALELDVPAASLAEAVSQMGQRLFEPPSVKGWDDHRAWLNSATMLVRMNSATAAAGSDRFKPEALLKRHDVKTGAAQRFFQDLLLDGAVPPGAQPPSRSGDADLRAWVRLLLTSPEYQLA